jgi:hypothetical protein
MLLHRFAKLNPPLLVQMVMQPVTAWESPVVQIHLLGRHDDEEGLERPWKGGGFMENATRAAAEWESAAKKRDARERKMLNGMKSARDKDKDKDKASAKAAKGKPKAK